MPFCNSLRSSHINHDIRIIRFEQIVSALYNGAIHHSFDMNTQKLSSLKLDVIYPFHYRVSRLQNMKTMANLLPHK